MRITAPSIGVLMCIAAAGQDQKIPIIACNLEAIGAAERPRYTALAKRVKAAILERRELAEGYDFTLDAKRASLTEVAQWIAFERLCCPFLNFQIEVSGQRSNWQVKLTGPAAAKAIVASEFPFPAK